VALAIQATEDLLNPAEPRFDIPGGHAASGAEQTIKGAVTGNPVKAGTGLTEVATYGTNAVSEGWNWLKGQW
jgi:hypothetical protein